MSRRRLAVLSALLGSTVLVAVGATSVGARTSAAGRSDHGTAYASINHVVHNNEYGSAINTDAILGASAITFKATLTSAAGKITLNGNPVVLYSKTGSLKGTLSATVTLSGTTETFSNGKLNLTQGAGSQKGHSLVGTFTGTGDASKNEFTIRYKGTYK